MNKIQFQSFILSIVIWADSNRNKLETLEQNNKAAPSSSSVGSNSKTLESNDISSTSPSFGGAPARFLTPNGTVITAQRGSTASLPCEVLSLGDGVVSSLIHND